METTNQTRAEVMHRENEQILGEILVTILKSMTPKDLSGDTGMALKQCEAIFEVRNRVLQQRPGVVMDLTTVPNLP